MFRVRVYEVFGLESGFIGICVSETAERGGRDR